MRNGDAFRLNSRPLASKTFSFEGLESCHLGEQSINESWTNLDADASYGWNCQAQPLDAQVGISMYSYGWTNLDAHASHHWNCQAQPSDAQVGIYMYNFGNERAAEGKWDDALLAWQNALEIFKISFGPKHMHVARAYHKIGKAYCILKEPFSAYCFFDKALALQQEILPPGDEQIMRTVRNMEKLWRKVRLKEKKELLFTRMNASS